MRQELEEMANELSTMVDSHVESRNSINEKLDEFRDKFDEFAGYNEQESEELFGEYEGLFSTIDTYVN